MYKKPGLLLLLLMLTISCNKRFEKAMKSSDKELILETANYFYEEGKWAKAIELYSKIGVAFAGTEEAADIAYNQADANYNDRNYRLAAHQFKTFYISNPRDPRAEDAAFRSAYAFYRDSPAYNLDQTSTLNAIDELQNFINLYPDSEHVSTANAYIDELRGKLEKKAFELAKLYYKTMKYKAAALSFDNMLDDFPDTQYREEAMMYSLRAKYELGVNFSRTEMKSLRHQEALTQYRLFNKAFPNSEFKEEAEKINRKILEDQEKTNKLVQRAAERKEELEEMSDDNS